MLDSGVKEGKSGFPYYKILLNIILVSGPVAFFIVLLIHFTIRDRYPIFSTIFYATPLPLLFGASMGLSVITLLAKGKRLFCYSLILCLVASSCWFGQSYVYNSTDSQGKADIRVLCWNVYRRVNSHFDQFKDVIQTQNPDIIGLIQVGNSQKKDAGDLIAKEFPEFHFEVLEKGMIIGLKGKVLERSYIDLTEGKVNKLLLSVKNKEVLIFLVHLGRRPDSPRKYPLNELYDYLKSHKNENLIVMGDFNTPYNSVWFDRYRKDFSHSFVSGGNGLMETWRMPLPLLSLDHLWTGANIKTISCSLIRNSLSDHKMIVSDLKFLTPDHRVKDAFKE